MALGGAGERCWSWAELGWVTAWALAVVVLTSVPYALGAARTPPQERYLGYVYNPDEPNVHLSWIRQAQEGAVFLRNEFTSEPHVGRFFNLYMLGLGRLAAALRTDPYRCWAGARLVGGVLLLLACYPALIALTRRRWVRRLGLALITLSSGLGWYWVGGAYGGPGGGSTGYPALDYLRVYANPVVALAVLLLVMALTWTERAVRRHDAPAAVGAAATGALLGALPSGGGGLVALWAVGWASVESYRRQRWDPVSFRYAAPIALGGALAFVLATPWLALVLFGVVLLFAALHYLGRGQADEGGEWDLVDLGLLVGVSAAVGVQQALLLVREPLYPAAFLGLAILGTLVSLWPQPMVGRLRWLAAPLLYGSCWAAAKPLGLDPVDVEPGLVMPEAFTFLSVYLNGFFTVSMALLVTALVLGRVAIERDSRIAAVAAGMVALLLANIHTYDSVPFLAVLTVYLLVLSWAERRWCWERFGRYGVIVLLTVPAVAYQSWLIRSEPLYAAKANTITATPDVTTMLVSYGLLWPLALSGLVIALAQRQRWFWAIWVIVHTACIWLPTAIFPFQRKMSEGLHVALALLATLGLADAASRLAVQIAWLPTLSRYRAIGWVWPVRADLACRRRVWVVPSAVVGLLALTPSTFLFVDSTLTNVAENNAAKLPVFMPPFRIPEADYQALLWMRDNLPAEAVVLCLPWVGNYLPRLAARRVYVGHWAETISYGEKLKKVVTFFQDPEPDAVKYGFLARAGITHLYYGSFERAALGRDPPALRELERIYPPRETPPGMREPVEVFRVRRADELEPVAEPDASPLVDGDAESAGP